MTDDRPGEAKADSPRSIHAPPSKTNKNKERMIQASSPDDNNAYTSRSRCEKDPKDQELIRLALQKSPFFTCLDEEQVQRFIQVAELKYYRHGQGIILEGCVDDVVEVDQRLYLKADETNSDSSGHQDQQQHNNDETEATAREEMNKEELALSKEKDELENFKHDENDSPPAVQPINNMEEEKVRGEAFSSGDPLGRKEEDEESGKIQAEGESIDSSSVHDTDNEFEQTKTNEPQHASTLQQRSSPINAERQQTNDRVEDTSNVPERRQIAPKIISDDDDPDNQHYLEPPPPKSGVPSQLYIIRDGKADVIYSNNVSPASLGIGTVFGEGGFLFGRQHSASVLTASEVLECFVVDATTFRNYVLPSDNMTKLYHSHATHTDEETKQKYMTMQDFVNSCLDQNRISSSESTSSDTHEEEDSNTDKGQTNNDNRLMPHEGKIQDPLASVRIANTFNIFRNDKTQGATTMFDQRISLADFCLFHLLMARPDPEVDITFLLMDVRKRGVLYKEDITNFLKSTFDDFDFDMESEFIHRHFGKDDAHHHERGIRPHNFPQFLVDLRREIGQQVFLREVERYGTPEGHLSPSNFVRVLKRACGWRLPDSVAERLENVYAEPQEEQEGSNGSPPAHYDMPEALDQQSTRGRLGVRYFGYCDFLAFQEVLGQLPGICNLIDRACEIKKGPISADDFKVANRVLGMGSSLSRRQVDIIFQLFDLDSDGYVSNEDTIVVAGMEVAQRLDAVAGRQGALTFAPPPKFRHNAQGTDTSMESLGVLLQNFSLTSIAGAIGVVALAPLDLVKTRMMNQRFAITGKGMYQHSFDCLKLAVQSEGYLGLYRGLLPQLIGIMPEKAVKLAVNDLLNQSLGIHGSDKSLGGYLQVMLAGGCSGEFLVDVCVYAFVHRYFVAASSHQQLLTILKEPVSYLFPIR